MSPRYSGSVAAIAAVISGMPDAQSKIFSRLGGKLAVVRILMAASGELLQWETLDDVAETDDGRDSG